MKKNKATLVSEATLRNTETLRSIGWTDRISFWARSALGVTAVFVMMYLWVINQNAVQGFAVRGAERAVADAKDENQQLRIEEAQLRSLGRITEAKDSLGLVESSSDGSAVSYLSVGSSLALR